MNPRFVTVVSGLPRSGTSMMMRMLRAGGMPVLVDGIRAADVSNPLGYFEYAPVKRTPHDDGWVSEARGKAVKVIYSLLRDLPAAYEYRIILMRRDVREVVASQSAMLRRSGEIGSDLSEQRLAGVFTREMARAEEWLHGQANAAMLVMEFQKCVTQPAAAAAEIGDFLGGGLDVDAMARAVDESLYRQRLSNP